MPKARDIPPLPPNISGDTINQAISYCSSGKRAICSFCSYPISQINESAGQRETVWKIERSNHGKLGRVSQQTLFCDSAFLASIEDCDEERYPSG